jgi:hypothetical protein
MTLSPDWLLLNFRIVGVLMALLVAVNLAVPARLNWREEMPRLSLINRQVVQAHSIFLILTLALLSALLLTSSETLLERSRLSRALLIGLTLFWGLRMLMQWFFYSRDTWQGNRFNTTVHYVFSGMWVYITATFGAALWSSLFGLE